MFKMTIEQALAVQARQCAHYETFHPGTTAMVAEATDTSPFEPGVEYDVVLLNRYVPRGGAIESLIGLCDQGGA